jgi:dTDP-4-amino-4,6-dideoxygalactose transaminase
MSDIMAAIGRVQLQRFELEFKPKRIQLAKRYRELLSDVEGIQLFDTDLGAVVPHIQPVRIQRNKRYLVRQILLNNNIQVGIHYKPNHLLTKYGKGCVSLPVTEKLYNEILTLPLHPDISLKELDTVIELVKQALR